MKIVRIRVCYFFLRIVDMDKYAIIGHIGEGAHGIVFKARCLKSANVVALKRIPLTDIANGIPCNTLREIKALREARHENVATMLDVFPYDGGMVLVLEYMPSDLSGLLRNTENPLTEPQVKAYMTMLLKGVQHCHSLGIMHRDLKPANLLISFCGVLKVADFGQAGLLEREQPNYSHEVATRWYRSPELLYGAHSYDEGVDLWAVGCIFGEMLTRHPLLKGENDIEQLCLVLQALGTPTEDIWPGMTELPDYNKISFPVYSETPWEKLVPECSSEALHLLSSFLVYSSDKRIRASEALLHEYFFTSPLPCCICHLPKPPSNIRGLSPSIDSTFLDDVSFESNDTRSMRMFSP